MSASTSPVSAAGRARALMRLNTAYFQSKVLQSAIELGVFDLLAEGPATLADIRSRLGIEHPLAMEFLDALVGLDLLDRDGDTYRNAASTDEFLVADGAVYLGGTMRQHARLHYHSWGRLTEALRGEQAGTGASHGAADYSKHYEDLDRARVVMQHMDAFNGFAADELAAHLDWSKYRTFVDVGGGRGNVAARLVAAHGHLSGAVFDLPALKPLFDELMEKLDSGDRVRFHGGDFRTEPLPDADVLIFGHVLIDWPPAEREMLLARSFEALRPGGALVIYDVMVDERLQDADALLQRINSSMVRGDSSAYSVADCRQEVEKSGFVFERAIAADTLVRDHIVVATRPDTQV